MRRVGRMTVVAVACIASVGCSRRLLGVLVDLPQASTNQQATRVAQPVAAPSERLNELLGLTADTIVPEIERTLDPDSVVAMLPRDHAGNIDWMAALRHEVIRPRHSIGGSRSELPGSFEFGFDFYFPGPTEMFDAYFPHSAHTEWVGCQQCHPRIFKSRGAEIKMADVFAGKFCGECHGKVAYPVMTGCERCHTGLAQPPNRAQPELIGTVRMRRARDIVAARVRDSLAIALAPPGDSVAPDSTLQAVFDTLSIAGNAAGVVTTDLPQAVFPHWVHRIRYRCKSCHMDVFDPRAGTNMVTMQDIQAGEACGRCHNGVTAFAPAMATCERCHVPPATAVAEAGGPPDR